MKKLKWIPIVSKCHKLYIIIAVAMLLLTNSNILNAQTKQTQAPSVSTPADFEYERDDKTGNLILIKYVGKSKNVVIPSYYNEIPITTIAKGAFSDPYYDQSDSYVRGSDIESIYIPNTIVDITNAAFAGCRNLKNVVIKGNITVIEPSTFRECNKLQIMQIPKSVKEIWQNAFEGCTNLRKVIFLGDSVEVIGNNAFRNCIMLDSIQLPNSIVSIGDHAFQGCTQLSNISIPNKITTIYSNTFSGCTRIKNITIPNNIRTIKSGAFSGCTSLTTIRIGEGMVSLEGGVFRDCNNLKKVYLTSAEPPNIESSLFDKSLVDLTISVPANLLNMYKNTVNWNTYSYIIKGDLPNIDPSTKNQHFIFGYNDDGDVVLGKYTGRQKEINIPTTYEGKPIIAIGDNAFIGCNITSVTIPNSVTAIGEGAFSYCHRLINIVIPDGVTYIGDGAFHYCSDLTKINIPDGITTIANNLFNNCPNLTTITIPNSVTSIGAAAFYESGLQGTIIIPKSVTYIGGQAFSECNATIRFESIIPHDLGDTRNWSVFGGRIEIPSGSREYYLQKWDYAHFYNRLYEY